ncbi:MAG: TonB-dependent receptor [candidate division Zixibacteria bacterium]|nr:TonB-dependent receptor [candidate division Zixibacteria bacterium]
MGFRVNGFVKIGVVLWGLLAVGAGSVLAGSFGQIKGTITDKEKKEPLPGVSILIKGTKIGGLTDIEGKYIIPRVEPGTYTLVISSVGYSTVEVTGVNVRVDFTTEVSQGMVTQAVTGQEIVITGTQDIINKTQTGSLISVDAAKIKTQPVQNVDNLLRQVAGVQTTSSGEVFIRGGRAGEVAYIVDGVPINDPLGGSGQTGANLTLVSGSIQEIQIIKDGFDPEYGNALSGIVNIRSQTGNKDNTKLSMRFLTDDFGNKSLNKYSRNNDNYQFILSGPDPILTTKILPAFGLTFLREKEFTYYVYFEMDQNDDVYQFWRYDSPSTRRNFGYFNLLGIKVPDRLKNQYNLQTNFKFRPQQNIKAVFSYKRMNYNFSNFNWYYRYSSAAVPVQTQRRDTYSFEWSHAVNKDMNYEAILSYLSFTGTVQPGDPQHPGLGLNPDQIPFETDYETYTDRNRNGIYDPPEPLINLFPDSMSYGTDFNGPAYTFGERNLSLPNIQGGGQFATNFQFNHNAIRDSLEGEPFIDLNGNGVWDSGDLLQDKNGNGKLDDDRVSRVDRRIAEPYIDGDSIIGEPFTDLNANGRYDAGIDQFVFSTDPAINQDLNHNGKYDGPDILVWTPGIPYYDRNGNGLFDVRNGQYDPGEPFADNNGNGIYDYGTSASFLSPGQHDADMRWQRRTIKTYRAEVKGYRQMGPHQLKAGFAVQKDDLVFQDILQPYVAYLGRLDGGPYQDRGAFRDFFQYQPISGTFYFRDQLEYGSMIATLGVRWDYFLQDTKDLALTLRNDDRGGTILGDRQKFSPRIGFSYPISDKAKVYFNYGHFFQQPQLLYMYQRNTASANQNDVVGNPNLDYQKTIQYSFGVKYAMSESYSVDIQGYFKDEFNKINSAKALEESGLYVQRYRNSDYGRSRGFELTVEKRSGGYVNGSLSYTYAFAYGKASQTNTRYLEEFYLSREPLSEAPLDNDIRHSLKTEVQILIPNTVKPRLFGIPIINGWSLSIQSDIQSGRPFTPDKSAPNIATAGTEDIERNSMRYPATAFFNVRFQKDFRLAGSDFVFNLWIENLFDNRNVNYISPKTLRPDTEQLQSRSVFGGTPYDQNPGHWDFGRQVKIGLQLSI